LVNTLDDFLATQYTLLNPDDDDTPIETPQIRLDDGTLVNLDLNSLVPARLADGTLTFITKDTADALLAPQRPFLDAIPVHPFTKKPMEYHRNAPPPTGVDRNTYDYRLYLIECAVGNSPKNYNMRSWREKDAMYATFLQSGGTYIRLGKNVTFFTEFPILQPEPHTNNDEDHQPLDGE
jgi:hypothetical protein